MLFRPFTKGNNTITLFAFLQDKALPKGCIFFNRLYTGGLYHCYILDESILHLRGAGSFLLLLNYF